MTRTITITDPKDYRNGDRFRGTSRNYKNSGAVVTVDNTLVGGTETRYGEYRYRDLYVKGNSHMPYVHIQSREEMSGNDGFWEDVTVTREVPDVEPDMPYGVYVAKIWTHSPESGVKWVHKRLDGKDTWKALTFDCEGDRSSSHSDHPRDFYAGRDGNWWDYITRLVAEQPETR